MRTHYSHISKTVVSNSILYANSYSHRKLWIYLQQIKNIKNSKTYINLENNWHWSTQQLLIFCNRNSMPQAQGTSKKTAWKNYKIQRTRTSVMRKSLWCVIGNWTHETLTIRSFKQYLYYDNICWYKNMMGWISLTLDKQLYSTNW